jgi:hypothetical protein
MGTRRSVVAPRPRYRPRSPPLRHTSAATATAFRKPPGADAGCTCSRRQHLRAPIEQARGCRQLLVGGQGAAAICYQ